VATGDILFVRPFVNLFSPAQQHSSDVLKTRHPSEEDNILDQMEDIQSRQRLVRSKLYAMDNASVVLRSGIDFDPTYF
jgi:hypothetical protein